MGFLSGQSDPAFDIVAASKSDTVNQTGGPFRGVVFGTAGILKVTTADDSDIAIPSGVLAAGVIHPLRVKRVWNTTTTAADIYLVK
jgi:hypothetical protein